MRAKEHEKDTAVWLLNLANDLRRLKNDSPLEDLPISTPQDTHSCIIANAFNYGCEVDPGGEIITFESQEDRDTYMKVMNLNKADYNFEEDLDFYGENSDHDTIWDTETVYYEWSAPMTSELVDIAESFDSGLIFKDYNNYEILAAEEVESSYPYTKEGWGDYC